MLRVRGSATQTGCVMRAVLLRLSETRHMHARHDNGPGSIRSAEFIGTEEARRRAGVAQRTIREWCVLHRIGRRIAGRWRVSQVALDMLLGEDCRALEAYQAGDRTSDQVRLYFARRNIALASQPTSLTPAATISAASSDYAPAIARPK